MKTRFQPLPDGEPPLDVKQFLHRLKHEAGFAETMQAHYESMLATPHTDATAEMHKAAQAALRTLKHHQGMWKAMKLLEQTVQLADPLLQSGRDAETMRRIRALTDEASDHLLDALEPDRTRLMARITAIREMVKGMDEGK